MILERMVLQAVCDASSDKSVMNLSNVYTRAVGHPGTDITLSSDPVPAPHLS